MSRLPVRGFTLIEVMVVIVIIAILVTMVSLSMRGDRAGEQIEEEGRRLAALLNLLREEAVMRDRDLGFALTPEGYHFVQAIVSSGLQSEADAKTEAPSGTDRAAQSADTAAFLPLTDDSVFRARALPPGTVLRFEAGPTTLAMPPAGKPHAPAILAIAQDLLMPEGRLVLTHPATERVAIILIRPDGAVVEEATDGR